jgi:hypothetical protein
MERSARTDERIDDFTKRVDSDIRELRAEMRVGFAEVRSEIAALRLMVMRFGGGLLIAQFGMIAALIARG